MFIMNYALANSGCSNILNKLVDRSSKMLDSVAEDLKAHLSNTEKATNENIYAIFDRLKAEEATFLDTYLNKFDKKRKMNENEIKFIQESYKLPNLTSEEIQIFYTNEIYYLYAMIEDAILARDTFEIIKNINLLEDEDAFQAISHTLFVIRGSLNTKELEYTASQVFDKLETLTNEQAVKIVGLYKELISENKTDITEELRTIGFAYNATSIQRQFKEKKVSQEICCNTGDGCLFCPNNLGLRFKNKQLE